MVAATVPGFPVGGGEERGGGLQDGKGVEEGQGAGSRAVRGAPRCPRCSSRWCRNGPVGAASRSARLSLLGGLPVLFCAKASRSLHVSR